MSKAAFSVVLTGPDGAGKSSITRQLENMLPLPAKRIYMGVNLTSSNLMLPTTRLWLEIKRARGKRPDLSGPPGPTRSKIQPKGIVQVFLTGVKSLLRLGNRLSEEWFRQVIVWYYQSRGFIILFDRHFFSDYYAYDIANSDQTRPLTSRIHGFLLNHFYPRPDLFICLDAPAEVLFARKGEGTLEFLEHRRQEYLQLKNVVENFAVVDATLAEEEVLRQVADLILGFQRSRSGQAESWLVSKSKSRWNR